MGVASFKNETRIRVNGILNRDEAVLLVQLESPVTNELVWMPPGGGLQFGESMKRCLQREFREETGLEIKVGPLCFVNELVKPPFHAVECYFFVKQKGGELHLGSDPELSEDDQLLKDLQWISVNKLVNKNVIPRNLKSLVQRSSSSAEWPDFYGPKEN